MPSIPPTVAEPFPQLSWPSTRIAYLLLAAVVLLWGINWPVMKFGLTMIPPFTFAVARLFLGLLTLFAVLAISGRLTLPKQADLPVILSVALLQMAAFLSAINLALLHVEAGRAAVLAYTTPLWVVPGATLLLGERLNRRRLLGIVLGVGGIVLLFNPAAFDWSRREIVIGNVILLLAALSWALAILHVRSHRWSGSPLQLAPWQMLVALPLLAALAWLLEDPAEIRWSNELWLVLAYNGPVATAFCYWAAVTVTRSLPAVSTSLGFLGVPVTGVLSAAIWLSEPITWALIGGLTAILAGLALVNLADLVEERRRTGSARPS